MKSTRFYIITLILLVNTCGQLNAQGYKMFFLSDQYSNYLKYSNADYLLFGPCLAAKLIVYPNDRIKAREYTMVRNDKFINSNVYSTYTYHYHPSSGKYRLKCSKSESSNLFGHQHTNGGYHYIKFDEFDDLIYMKTCGVSRSAYKFRPYKAEHFLR